MTFEENLFFRFFVSNNFSAQQEIRQLLSAAQNPNGVSDSSLGSSSTVAPPKKNRGLDHASPCLVRTGVFWG
jgi:hypothetical protein